MTSRRASRPYTILENDCIEAMRNMAPDSIDAIITDPPYGIEFMGKEWEQYRVTARHGRWSGTRSGSSGGRIDAHDKPGNVGGARVAYGGQRPTTYRCHPCGKRDAFRNPHDCTTPTWRREVVEPNTAPPSMLAFAEWVRQWGIEAMRVLKPGGHLLAFGASRTYHRLAAGLEDAGFDIRDTLMWLYGEGYPKSHNLDEPWEGWGTTLKPAHEPITLARKPLADTVAANMHEHGTAALNIAATTIAGGHGDQDRWPANVILDPAAASALDAQSSAFGEPGASRFFYVAKPTTAERTAGIRNGVKHPTVKPVTLMRQLVKLVAAPGATILDPFAGSGTTGIAACVEGFRFVGVEHDPEFAQAARDRLAHWLALPPEQLDAPTVNEPEQLDLLGALA